MRKAISILVALLIFFGGVGAATLYQFTLSTDTLYANGTKIDAPMYKYNGVNHLPLKTVADALGADVSYSNGRIDIDNLTDLETVVKKVKDSCVMVNVYRDGKLVEGGSGFVYNENFIITAKHVTDAGDKYAIFIDDSIYAIPAKKVDIQTDLDVSVLSIGLTLPSVTLGDSDKLIEGQKLVAITSPGGFKNRIDECVYTGISYNRSRYHLGISESEMEAGSSGGAVFNLSGSLIGMNVIGEGSSNDVIPINGIKPMLIKIKS